jgi:threonine dehydratase
MLTQQKEYPDLAKALEAKSLFLKREDLHPYGSHKGRSIPIMIDTYAKEQNIRHFAISSSGNAALAAAFHVQKLNKNNFDKIKLDILVGQKITTKKLRKLEQFKNDQITITSHDRPIQTLFKMVEDPKIKALRQSTDDLALIGYESLAEELLEIKDLRAVFIGTSSGTTAQALAEYFKNKEKKIEIHVVQTSSCHPISNEVSGGLGIDEVSIADAIVDHTAIRKDKLLKLIEESGGGGWIASNEQIKVAQEMAKKYADIDISTNSALSIVGLTQALCIGKNWDGAVVCVICGD